MKRFFSARVYLVWILALTLFAMPFAYAYGLIASGIEPGLETLVWVCFIPQNFTEAISRLDAVGILRSLGLLVSHQFFHLNASHLVGNMMPLLVFGIPVEKRLGAKHLLSTFLLAGIAGGIVHWLSGMHHPNPLLGASGAIGGILGVYAYLFITRSIVWNVYEYARVFFLLIAWLVPNILAVLGYFQTEAANVAVNLHLGAFAAGIVLGFWYVKDPNRA